MLGWITGRGRVWALTVATALVASGIGLASALISGGADDEAAETPVPTLTPAPTLTLTTPSPSPTATATPTPTAATATPAASPGATIPPTQDAAAVDCNRDPTFCSNETGLMTVANDRLTAHGKLEHSTDYSAVPASTMTWEFLKSDGTKAEEGDKVSRLRVFVVIENKTADRTFVFPRREVVLETKRNGSALDPTSTTGESFEMTPGAKLDSSFEVPITLDGSYEWRSKTWFYERR